MELANKTRFQSSPKESEEYLVNATKAKASKAAGLGILSATLCIHLARSHVLYNNRPDEVKSMTDKECFIEMILDVPHYEDASTNPYERESRKRGFALVAPSLDLATEIADIVLKVKAARDGSVCGTDMSTHLSEDRIDFTPIDANIISRLDSF